MAAVWCQLRLQGPHTYQCSDVSKPRVIIGRSKKCDLVIAEPSVSSKHLSIECLSDGRVVVVDEPGSTGSFVKSKSGRYRKLTSNHKHELRHGDYVAMGATKDVFFSLDLSNQTKNHAPTRPSRKRELSSTVPAGPSKKQSVGEANDVPTTSKAKPIGAADDSLFLQEFLTCHICQNLLYEPVNVAPCNHVFCGGCLSPWLKTSRNCPTCRTVIKSVGLHHILKNILHEFVKRHPEAQRTLEDCESLDKQDTITKPKPKRRRRQNQQQQQQQQSSENSSNRAAEPFVQLLFSMLNNSASGQTVTFNTLASFGNDGEVTFGDPGNPMVIDLSDSESEFDEDDDDDEVYEVSDEDDDGDDNDENGVEHIEPDDGDEQVHFHYGPSPPDSCRLS